MRMKGRMAVVGIVGVLAWSGVALAQQPINLLSPTSPFPSSGNAIQATPLPPPTALSPPLAATAPPGPPVTTLPMLPARDGPSYTAAVPYLETAQSSISDRRYVTAGEALEQAETSLLNDGLGTSQEADSAATQALLQVRLARQALAYRDQASALAATGRALAATEEAGREAQIAIVARAMPPTTVSPSQVSVVAPPVPMITKALLPGRWQLSGWQYRWVPPETELRPVDTRAYDPSHYVWRDGAWVWDPGHYGND